MTDSLPQLPVAFYHLHFVAGTDGVINEDPRGLWHGVFGRALREISCVRPGIECSDCDVLFDCPYSKLFSAPRPPETELMRRYTTVPVPHVFHVPPEHPRTLLEGQALDLGLVLVGDANDGCDLMIQAMAEAGNGGLGAGRLQLWLQQVEQHVPGRGEPWLLAAKGEIHDAQSPEMPALPPAPERVRMQFLTAYKASGKPVGGHPVEIERLLMAIVRRISLLQYFYTGQRLEAAFDQLKLAAQRVVVLGCRMQRQRAARYAAGHGRQVDHSGLVGEIDLDLSGCEALWPYLHLGQWLNVGKSASMGFGDFTVDALA